MKTQTDNNTISTKVESLEDAYDKWSADTWDDESEPFPAFKGGANWKEKQLLPIIESHKNLLGALYLLYESVDSCVELTPELLLKCKQAIEKANNIKP